MAKFVIECPKCGAYHQASTSLFAKKVFECSCGNLIDTRRDKLKTVNCPNCKNVVAYDQSKGEKATCPVCKTKLTPGGQNNNTIDIPCPTCSAIHTIDKNARTYECVLCDTVIDVQEQVKKTEIKNKGIATVIKYEGPNDVFVWKHPVEDFNIGSQLIVHESQEAIFFKDGKALDLFGPGRHTLETNNVPLLKDFYKKVFSDQDAFHSEVYYINLVTQMGIKWGTDSRVRMFDPISGLHVEIGASGQFNIKVANARKLILKLVGTTGGLNQSELYGSDFSGSGITSKFKALVMTKVKSFLGKTIRENDINILEVDEHLDDLSNVLKSKINDVLEDYGLTMPEFFVTTILTPDDDPNFKRLKLQAAERYLKVQQERILQAEAEAAQGRKIVESQTAAQQELIAAQAKAQAYKLQAEAEAEEMKMKGYTYQQETARQVATAAVTNEGGVGGGSGTGGGIGDTLTGLVGLGVGLGVMGEVVKTVKGTLDPAVGQATQAGQSIANQVKAETWDCQCGQKEISTKFCPECGAKKVEPSQGWTCSCGQTHITSKFCPNCGKKEEPVNQGWTCSCGQTHITSKFCPSCGKKSGE